MKKILLIIAITGCLMQVNGQQFTPKPPDTPKIKLFEPDSRLYNPFQYQPSNLGFNYSPLATYQTLSNVDKQDHMPVVILSGQSKMPVVRLDG